MKKLYFLLLFVSTALMAQVPQGFSYQAVALNTSGSAVASSPVQIRISILDGSATGTAAYVETHNPTTNNVGLFNLAIGMGTPVTGTFAGVNWAENSKFLKVEIDVNNGTNYVTVGSSQLLSVPYAMYAGAVAGFGSGNGGTSLTQLFLYGTFNSFNAATAIQMANNGNDFYGYKYLTAGSQIKFLTALNSSAAYGNGGGNELVLGGTPFMINADGIYNIKVIQTGAGSNGSTYNAYLSSMSIKVAVGDISSNYYGLQTMTYNAATNTLSTVITVTSSTTPPSMRKFKFRLGTEYDYSSYGDNLGNGTIDVGGEYINLPGDGLGTFLITLNLNFAGDGSPYTITPQ